MFSTIHLGKLTQLGDVVPVFHEVFCGFVITNLIVSDAAPCLVSLLRYGVIVTLSVVSYGTSVNWKDLVFVFSFKALLSLSPNRYVIM
jgi:hypothetical protein